jgi:hypothetical protein
LVDWKPEIRNRKLFRGHILMTKNKRQAAAFLMLLMSALTLGWGSTEQEIRASAEAVKTVSADFVQEKHMKMLVRPLTSRGRFVFAAPDSLRWQYDEPLKSLLLTHDGKTFRYGYQQGRWVEEGGLDLQAMQVVIEQIAGWLGGHFDDSDLFSVRMAPGRRIVLVPKKAGIARFIERIELQLSDTPGVLSSVVLIEGEQAFTRIRFSEVRVNGAVTPREFKAP